MGIVSGMRFAVKIQEDNVMNKVVKIILAIAGVLAVAGIVAALVTKHTKRK